MKASQGRAIFALLLLLSLFLVLRMQGCVAPTERWQYKVISPTDDTFQFDIDAAGYSGWEAISIRRVLSQPPKTDAHFEVVLKRRS